jgi:protein TonB
MDLRSACISLQSIAMTNKEILQADLLDILFEHRNKAYGAYALRRNYSDRLHWALGISLGIVLILILALNQKASSRPSRFESHEMTLESYVPSAPKPPEQPAPSPRPQRAQVQYPDQVRIVPDNVKPNMPDQQEIQNAQISTQTIQGLSTDAPVTESTGNDSQDNLEVKNKPLETTTVLSSSEAQFPGGVESFKKFLIKYLVTPDDLQLGESKTVRIRFKVDVDGSISGAQILQSAGEKYDREVLRVLNKMPKWVPATQNGVKVPTWFTQPVTFIGVE